MLYYGKLTKDTIVYEYHDTIVDKIAIEQLLRVRLREEYYTTTVPYKHYYYIDTIAGERKLIDGDYIVIFPFGCAVLSGRTFQNSIGGIRLWNKQECR